MADFAHVRDPALRHALACWLDARNGRLMPARGDLDPAVLGPALPRLWIAERDREAGRFRYLFAGEAIAAVHGRDLRGLDLLEPIAPDRRAAVTERIAMVISEPAVLHGVGAVFYESGRAAGGERLILPLAEDGATADGLLGVTAYGEIGQRDREVPRAILTYTPIRPPRARTGRRAAGVRPSAGEPAAACAALGTIAADLRDEVRHHCRRCSGAGDDCLVERINAYLARRAKMAS